jgi:hypothetical protein
MHRFPPFSVRNPDHERSPFTGMNRGHWLQAAHHLMEGVFSHVSSIEDPLVFPKVPGKTYPQPNDPEWRFRSLEWEGLVRTLNAAAPLLMEDPGLVIRGIPVAAYYRKQLGYKFHPNHPLRLPSMASLADTVMLQMTCEFGGLCVLLLQYPGLERLLFDEETRPAFLDGLSEYAHGRTGPQNWRFFNVMMLTYLISAGREVDQELYVDHLNEMMACHAGDGWYCDAEAFDYYTAWVYHIYAVLWCRVHGDAHDPARAKAFRAIAAQLLRTYPRLFARDGHMIMWGRSICYRTGAGAPLPTVMDLPEAGIDPGWARRIQSGNLLQFLTRAEFLHNAVPSLGFYGHCEAVLQPYLSSASPFWLALTFGALSLPEQDPYWQAVESEGPWPGWGGEPACLELTGPGLHVVNRAVDGTTELRPGKVSRHPGANYSRLAYHSRLLWEPDDIPAGVTAASYCFRAVSPVPKPPVSLSTYRTHGVRDGVLYRKARTAELVFFIPPRVDMAEVILPLGVLRIDRIRVSEGAEVSLGHYALPADARPVVQMRRQVDGCLCVAVQGERGSLALTAVHGWDDVAVLEHEGFSADIDAPRSFVPFATRKRPQVHRGTAVVITVLLQRFDGAAWTEDELQPVVSFEQGPGEAGVQWVDLVLKDGRKVQVRFDTMDGTLG